jgi:hypothetical protein
MLRGNLSTRPFYNERLASVVIGAVVVVAVLLTGFNIWRLTVLSSERAAVKAKLDESTREIDRIQSNTAALRRAVDRPTLGRLAVSAREANGLIDARTFSWTTLFGLLEKTMPMDVRLTAVTPRVEKGTIKVAMNVVARDFDDLERFQDALGEAGAFYDVAAAEQRKNEDGQIAALVEASYLAPSMIPSPPAQAPPAAPSPAGQTGGKP